MTDQEIKKNNDPILNSIFSQAKYKDYNEAHSKVIVSLGQNFNFFKDWIAFLNRLRN